ncbi:hypothetical protein GCM10010116_40630 [Microbispora rosea subsp. aerata]|nr:hypothetical protein GCM10010116_40630 [Microbispora rosea subsp. aerata]GIH57200.1 hypothetical protein Mro02_41140 [Microbispora rosea subsp. aerata]GLJ84730.1 hypothetical protein GCM10017588_34580 [Microbispora rosea subsp. aerata]
MGISRGRTGTGGARALLDFVSGWGIVALAGVAGAVAAGTVPDVIKSWLGEQRPFLTALCLVSALTFAAINLWQQRSKGVGIVISLPQTTWRGPWSSQWMAAAADHARRHHDSCFVVRRAVPAARPGDDEEDRAAVREGRRDALELAYELATARLTELSEADASTPVSLYVNAALPDAFELGAMFKFNVQRRLRAADGALSTARHRAETHEIETSSAESADQPVSSRVVLPQRSERAGSDFFPSVRISSHLKEPLTPAEAARASALVKVIGEPDYEEVPDATAVAVVVHLADNPLMVAQALRAARDGCADTDGRWERCRAALVIDGGSANLPETTVDFELVVRHVYAAWNAWIEARPQYANLRPRLFIAAPASVAFALGWLLGHTVKAVPHPYQTDKAGKPCISS